MPPVATELFDLAGRWGRERSPQRLPFVVGVHSRENRRGRTGPDAPLILAAGTGGFDTRQGEVWAVHVAWSGNHVTYAERLSNGFAVLGGGELLLSGEVVLAAGETYTGPWVYGAHGVRARRHRRPLPHPPARPPAPPAPARARSCSTPGRPSTSTTTSAGSPSWPGSRRRSASSATSSTTAGSGTAATTPPGSATGTSTKTCGRTACTRSSTRSAGSAWSSASGSSPRWSTSTRTWRGPTPTGSWGTGGRTPLPSRYQQVLDLAHPDAYAYILERLDALLTEYPIAYLKWDHNRDLLEAGRGADGTPGVHAQTAALYRLLDELRAPAPRASRSSRAPRAGCGWTSRSWSTRTGCGAATSSTPWSASRSSGGRAQLIPPELVGSHVGAPRAHTTGRTHDLSFRAGTALFGSFGIEWDLAAASDLERKELASWVALYKEVRELVHTGEVVRAPQHDPSFAVHGVVAHDRSEALFALVQLTSPETSVPGAVRLPGLDPARRYRVRVQPPGDLPDHSRGITPPPWIAEGVTLPGSALAHTGLRAPALFPEQLLLLRVRAAVTQVRPSSAPTVRATAGVATGSRPAG